MVSFIYFVVLFHFTPFRIEDAQPVHFYSLNSAHSVGVLNEKRCNTIKPIVICIVLNKLTQLTREYSHVEKEKQIKSQK